ncbi:hypothetical protein F4802DRAFT_612897 [Xylaria palmicola]|nr:hypothetical protein F4802DRAFT_612897 [Xylaria palmicola]
MPPPENNPQPFQRRKRPAYPSKPSLSFWGNLSTIPLTKRALKELQRTIRVSLSSTKIRPSSPLCRLYTQRTAAQHLDHFSLTELRRIKRIARNGGPNLSSLRGYYHKPSIEHMPDMNEKQSCLGRRRKRDPTSDSESSSDQKPPAKRITPYSRAFQQHLIDNGIFPNRYQNPEGQILAPPENLEEILQAMTKPRPDLSPSHFTEEDFETFLQAHGNARKESQVMATVISIIEGEKDVSCTCGKIPFKNLDYLTENNLAPGNPDIYYGSKPEQLNQEVREKLRGHIVPSTQDNLPILPNFFLSVKGPAGSQAIADREASYNGTLGARGIDSLQKYGDPDFDSGNKAYTVSSTFNYGCLQIYTIHVLSSTGSEASSKYLTRQIKGYVLTSDIDQFRAGVSAYRNLRDWAKEKRDEAIQKANKRAAREKLDKT